SNFMPTADQLRPYVSDARMIALCSPLNPTGTVFSKEALSEICQMVIEENRRRAGNDKPLYIMYDQVYSVLCMDGIVHYDPVSLFPELREFTVCIDGMSKSFAGTGIRVGWAFGPQYIISRMRSILSHVGAWSPKAEQVAAASYLSDFNDVQNFLDSFLKAINERLEAFYQGFMQLKKDGFKVDAIVPQAAIYLTVQFDLKGLRTSSGKLLSTNDDVTNFLCDEAGVAIVPFSSFGSSVNDSWYRVSVGVAKSNDIPVILDQIRKALGTLS
ncbi:MAG: pyridoxal phosphate-dependent aminotransferase, partial [Bacteroidia bacterium]